MLRVINSSSMRVRSGRLSYGSSLGLKGKGGMVSEGLPHPAFFDEYW